MNNCVLALAARIDLPPLLEELRLRGHPFLQGWLLWRAAADTPPPYPASAVTLWPDHGHGFLRPRAATLSELMNRAALITFADVGTCLVTGQAALLAVEAKPTTVADLLEILAIAPDQIPDYAMGLAHGLVLIAQPGDEALKLIDIADVFAAWGGTCIHTMPATQLAAS